MSGRVALDPSGVALRLARITRSGDLILCEAVQFVDGWAAVEKVLRRAAISGRVEVDGNNDNHFADVLDVNGSMVNTVSLDGNSYAALKNRWSRCKVKHYQPNRGGVR